VKIIPAIDIKSGQCVRLYQGNFDQSTEYSADPAAVARRFSTFEFEHLHIVDLDGARTGQQHNRAIVAKIAAESGLEVQLGGGIRARDDIARWLDAGVSRCVVGSMAVEEPQTVQRWLRDFGLDAIVLALDIQTDRVRRTHVDNASVDEQFRPPLLWDCIDSYRELGARHVLCTDVARDGTLKGPNFDLYSDILARYPELIVQASGGIRNIADLRKLRKRGIPAAITGRALLDGKIVQSEVTAFRQSA